MGKMKTRKTETKIIGLKRFVDVSTGEVFNAEVIVKDIGDANFKKIWIGHILEAIEEIGNAKMVVLFWLMDHADHNNRIYGTVRSIAEDTKVSTATVARLMRVLQESNVIKREFNGVWQLNPEVVFKGTHNRRMDVLIRYRGKDVVPDAI